MTHPKDPDHPILADAWKVGNFENSATPVELMAWDVLDITDRPISG